MQEKTFLTLHQKRINQMADFDVFDNAALCLAKWAILQHRFPAKAVYKGIRGIWPHLD